MFIDFCKNSVIEEIAIEILRTGGIAVEFYIIIFMIQNEYELTIIEFDENINVFRSKNKHIATSKNIKAVQRYQF